MKKLTLVAAMLFAANVYADGDQIPTSGRVLMTDCQHLNEDVSVPLSNNVKGAYNCPDGQLTIRVATCHTNGRVSQRTERVGCNDPDLLPEDEAYIEDAPVCDGSADGANLVTSTGANFYHGQTTGGRLLPVDLNGDLCEDATIQSKVGL